MTAARLRSALADPSTVTIGALAGVAGVLGSYALAGLTPAFVAAPIAGFLARTLPGALITAVILTLGSLGQALNLVTALAIAGAILAAVAIAGIASGRRTDSPMAGAAIVAIGDWLVAFVLTGAPVAAIGAGIGAGVVVAVGELVRDTPPASDEGRVSGDRRHLLGALATVVGVGIAAGLLQWRARATSDRRVAEGGGEPAGAGTPAAGSGSTPAVGGTDDPARRSPDGEADRDPEIARLLGEAEENSLDIGGMEPLVSEKFYQVDINAADPDLSADEWSLAITKPVGEEEGSVEPEPALSIGYDELTSMPAEHRFVTLRCVGESLNGHKMDNALWTGVPVADLLDRVDLPSGCACVMLRAADGYFEEFPLAALRRGFLAYGMNGDPLPRAHGYPVRALIPGHWGEINVKWLTTIEFLDRETDGYWEKRGWHGTGPVNTVAKLHAVNHLDGGRIQVGGHAYAGLRGVSAVEASTDGGETWAEATLSEPLPGDDVWRQWAYEYRPPGGPHEVVVRAVEADGTVQPSERAPAFPNGPSGWVRQTVRPGR